MSIDQALAAGGMFALPLAFVGGIVAGLNPCCLALYPAMTATCCAAGATGTGRMVPRRAAAFVLGTAIATTVLGVLAALAGHAVALMDRWARYAVAFVPVLVGLHLLGWIRLPIPWLRRSPEGSGSLSAFLAGLSLSLIVGSCATPLLAAILFAAYKGSVAFGGLLLMLYGLGNGLPMLLLGTGVGALVNRFQLLQAWADRLAGGMFLAIGFYLLLRV